MSENVNNFFKTLGDSEKEKEVKKEEEAKKLPYTKRERTCDGCTACCDGWLAGQAYGKQFKPGKPCHFKCKDGCSIYETRPEEPCKTFKCLWLDDGKIVDLPEWMKPSESGVIVTPRIQNGHLYVQVLEMGRPIDPNVLSWFFVEHTKGNIVNLRWQANGGWHTVGTPAFLTEMGGN